jgi:DNA primase
MARIPDTEIERLKAEVSLVRLVEASGVELKRHGKDWVGRCPWHQPDRTPSLVVSVTTNLWHCMGACQVGGSVIDWVMKCEGVSFRHAVERLRADIGTDAFHADERAGSGTRARLVPTGMASARSAAPLGASHWSKVLEAAASADDDAVLLGHVIDYYHETLAQSPEAKQYLESRGIYSVEAIETFKLGFANRTLGYWVPNLQLKAGARLRAALQRVGVYRASGHEHLSGSLIVPVCAPDGAVMEVYGRKISGDTKLRAGTPLHLYLPGPHRGVFNEAGLVGQQEVILCEALIDALTFWCAGYRNVTSSYGIEGFTSDLLDAFKRHGIQRVLIAYDADDAGNSAAAKLATRLMSEGFDCYRCRFPKGMDANEYALAVKPAVHSLGIVIRQAEWLGQGVAPERITSVADRSDAAPVSATASTSTPAPLFSLAAALAVEAEAEQSQSSGASPALQPPAQPPVHAPAPAAHRVPARAVLPPVTISASGELTLVLSDRVYRVRGIEKNLSYEQIKVLLRASRGDFLHIDTVDLFVDKQRQAWGKAAASALGLSEAVAGADLVQVLRAVETRQHEILQQQLAKSITAAPAPTPLSPAEHEAAMALLKDPALIDRIVADVEATGVVGEASNALVAYLACVSRKLDKPLAILIQSTSAAGKSTLMDALLALMPESERVHYSAMTGQSLFYLGETSMKHKILAIAEEEGVRQAAYALKVLQSSGELTIASTGKDPTTGDLQTKTYKVEGPVMLFLTTTAIDIDEELLNRCLVLTINESREQTAAIQAKQRASRTLSGLLTKAHCDAVLATHRAAQQLLLPLAVVNPFAEQLTFASDRVRLRRDHQKYLALIDAIALLHQHQRPICNATVASGILPHATLAHPCAAHAGKDIAYIEVTLEDIALANRLAHEVLGRSLDELPPQTRRLLGQVQQFVAERAAEHAIERSLVRFTRRELREHTHLSLAQLAVHIERLLELEYLIAHNGRGGQRFVYELVFDGQADADERHLPGLMDMTLPQGTTANLSASNSNLQASEGDLQARCRVDAGLMQATCRPTEIPHTPRPDAVLLPLAAAVDQTAQADAPRPQRRTHGASYAGPAAARTAKTARR